MENLLENMDHQWGPEIVGQTLRGAADRLERFGWCQYTSVNAAKNECAAQAIGVAAAELSRKPEVREVAHPQCSNAEVCTIARTYLSTDVSNLLAKYVRQPYVVYWNDQADQTAERVITSMRQCADHVDPPK